MKCFHKNLSFSNASLGDSGLRYGADENLPGREMQARTPGFSGCGNTRGQLGHQVPVNLHPGRQHNTLLFLICFPNSGGSSWHQGLLILLSLCSPLVDPKLPWVKWEDPAEDYVVTDQFKGKLRADKWELLEAPPRNGVLKGSPSAWNMTCHLKQARLQSGDPECR